MRQIILLMPKLLILGIALLCSTISLSQHDKLKVFVDCNFCGTTYFRQNLDMVDYVRDRKLADVHLLFIEQRNGSGGSTQRIQFIGQGPYEGMIDTVTYSIDVNMTWDETRQKQLKHMELGLVRYWLKKGETDNLSMSILSTETTEEEPIKDPWNYWVFGVELGGWGNGQETNQSVNVNGTIRARRITEENRFTLTGRYNRNFQRYVYDDTIILANQQNSWLDIEEVLSINDHWSYGFFGNLGNSIFGNYEFYSELTAGIEYNIFPYAESATKQVVIGYEIGGRYNDYYDTTIFNLDRELRGFHRIRMAGAVNQKWGGFDGAVSFRHFLHDAALNSTSFRLGLNVRLFKGFNWRINGGFNLMRDQINLSKGEASLEDLLLSQQQLGSNYSYWGSTGISYSFGSIYNSIVNPRFDI